MHMSTMSFRRKSPIRKSPIRKSPKMHMSTMSFRRKSPVHRRSPARKSISLSFSAQQIRDSQIKLLKDNLEELRESRLIAPAHLRPEFDKKAKSLVRRIRDLSGDINFNDVKLSEFLESGGVEYELDPKKSKIGHYKSELDKLRKEFRETGKINLRHK